MSEQQPTFPQINVNIPPEGGMLISAILAPGLLLSQHLSDETMLAVVKTYLGMHPELTQELIRETLTLKHNPLAVIEHVKRSRND